MKAFILQNEIAQKELASLALKTIRSGGLTDFDLYIEIGGHMVLYAPAPYRWAQPEIDRLGQEGHQNLFYYRTDHIKVVAFQKISSIPVLNIQLAPPQRLRLVTEIAAEFNRVLFEHPLTPTSLEKGREIANDLVQCVLEDPKCIQALGLLARHDQYTYFHSGRVAAYALAIAIRMGEREHRALTDLALGCLLHDIGKSKIDLHIINKPGPLSEMEWQEMRKHPEYGSVILNPHQIPLVATEVVIHHHERIDGKGYPHGLGKHEILAEVNIASFADVFDALTTNRPYQSSRTKFEALAFIRDHLMENFRDPYAVMVEILAEEKDE